MRKLPESIEQEIIEMYQQGMKVRSIAEEVGCAESAVYDTLRRNGVELRDRREDTSGVDYEEVGADYKEGKLSVAQLMAKYGIGISRLYIILDTLHIPLRKITQVTDFAIRMKYAVEMYKQGVELIKIRADTGIRHQGLYEELGRLGIPIRRRHLIDWDKAVELYQTGYTIGQIKAVTGAYPAALYVELSRRGIPVKGRKPGQMRADALKRKNDGLFALLTDADKESLVEYLKEQVAETDSSQVAAELDSSDAATLQTDSE